MSDNMKDKRNPRFMGKVKKWNSERGFGFIKCFEDGKEYYINSRFIGDKIMKKNRVYMSCGGSNLSNNEALNVIANHLGSRK